MISLTSETPVLLAASISTTSILLEEFIELQFLHVPHESKLSILALDRQFTILAISRAKVVLPTPLVPERRYACANLLFSIAPFNI